MAWTSADENAQSAANKIRGEVNEAAASLCIALDSARGNGFEWMAWHEVVDMLESDGKLADLERFLKTRREAELRHYRKDNQLCLECGRNLQPGDGARCAKCK